MTESDPLDAAKYRAQFRFAFPCCLLPGGSRRDPNGTSARSRGSEKRWNGTEWDRDGGGSVTDRPIDYETTKDEREHTWTKEGGDKEIFLSKLNTNYYQKFVLNLYCNRSII